MDVARTSQSVPNPSSREPCRVWQSRRFLFPLLRFCERATQNVRFFVFFDIVRQFGQCWIERWELSDHAYRDRSPRAVRACERGVFVLGGIQVRIHLGVQNPLRQGLLQLAEQA